VQRPKFKNTVWVLSHALALEGQGCSGHCVKYGQGLLNHGNIACRRCVANIKSAGLVFVSAKQSVERAAVFALMVELNVQLATSIALWWLPLLPYRQAGGKQKLRY